MANRDWKKFCYGTPKSNARAIGWFHVIGSVAGILLLIFALTKLDMEDETRDPMFALIIAIIIGLVVNFGMGIVLLKGSYNKNPCQLKAWLIYQSILVVLDVIGCAFLVFTSHAFIIILQSLLSISFQLYVMTIVNNHRKEIKASIELCEVPKPVC